MRSVRRCLSLRKRISDIDIQLRKSYNERKMDKEQKLFQKAKDNKNVLFKYIKKAKKNKSKI